MIRVALVGAGYWGKNLERVLNASARFDVWAIIDPAYDADPMVSLACESLEVARDEFGVNAAVIATPASTHAEIALEALGRGLHVLVEKPLATSSADGERLCAAAQAAGRVLMVDHTYLYSPRVATLEVVLAMCGPVEHWASFRTHHGGPGDVSALWDLLPHDLAIARALIPGWAPMWVECAGDPEDGQIDITGLGGDPHVTVRYSRRSEHKRRTVVVDAEGATAEWNDQAADPIRLWRKGQGVGSWWGVPCRSQVEPLANMVDDFADAIEGRECRHPARSSGVSAVWGLRIIEAAEQSLVSGKPERIT